MPPEFDDLSENVRKLLHRFEQDWIAQNQPGIDEYLERFGGQHDIALPHLIALDVHYRTIAKEELVPSDYKRFAPDAVEFASQKIAQLSGKTELPDSSETQQKHSSFVVDITLRKKLAKAEWEKFGGRDNNILFDETSRLS